MRDRIKIIQRLIRATGATNYLEIGVNNGACFLRLKAAHKMAVDPAFKISRDRKLKYYLKNTANFNNHYFEQTSDDFFASKTEVLAQHSPGIVFVDGLHTYEQSLRDVINSLTHLKPGGVVLMHDCNPMTESAGFPADSIDHAKAKLNDYHGIWNGDVWKAIVHMRSLHSDLEVFVLDCDHGIGVVRRGKPHDTLNYSRTQVRELSYEDLAENRALLLNLKTPAFLEEFIQSIISESRSSVE
jgi:hypothetical protein